MSFTKSSLRSQILSKRNSLSLEDIAHHSEKISKRILKHPKFLDSKSIFLYFSIGSEVSTTFIIEESLKLGKNVFLPVLDNSENLSFHKFESFSKMKKGKFGILEPTSKVSLVDPDLVVVPGLAFDLHLHRLGYGKGYYDRFLKSTSSYKIGICFDFQIVEKIPNESHDQKMDEVISEKRILV